MPRLLSWKRLRPPATVCWNAGWASRSRSSPIRPAARPLFHRATLIAAARTNARPTHHIQLIGGFVLLFVGGEALVRGAVSLAQRLHVSPLLIGATVVAFGTSMPELVVTLQAALRGSFGIAFGNVIGSNVANLMLILGLAVVITPVLVSRRAVARDGGALIGATALLVVFTSLGTLVAWQGALMLVLLGLLTCASYWHERRTGGEKGIRHRHEAEERSTCRDPSGSPCSPRCSGSPASASAPT